MHGLNFSAYRRYSYEYKDRDSNKKALHEYAIAVLKDAWRKVLLKNPETILALRGEISLYWMCEYPYGAILDPTHTVEWVDDYLEQGLAALARVDNEYLQVEKESCGLYLKRDHKRMRKFIAGGDQSY